MKHLLTMLTLLFGLSFHASAEQKFVKDNWDIHYIAFPSSFLQPHVAKSYDLTRSKYNAIVNISVLDNSKAMQAQSVYISGTAKNLLGQTKKLSFTKVEEDQAIYYLAQLEHRNEENVTINIKIQQGNRTETIKFKKKLYVD